MPQWCFLEIVHLLENLFLESCEGHPFLGGCLEKIFPAPQSCDTFRTATLPLLAKFGIEEQLSFKVVGVMMSWRGGLRWYQGMFGYKTSNLDIFKCFFCWCCHWWLMNLVSFLDWVWSCFRNKVQNRNDKMDREDDNISTFLHRNSESKGISIFETSSGAISNYSPSRKEVTWGLILGNNFGAHKNHLGGILFPFPPKNHNEESAAESTFFDQISSRLSDFEAWSSSLGWWRGGLYLSHYQGGVECGAVMMWFVFFSGKNVALNRRGPKKARK